MNDGVIYVCVVIALPPIYCLFTSGLEQDLARTRVAILWYVKTYVY